MKTKQIAILSLLLAACGGREEEGSEAQTVSGQALASSVEEAATYMVTPTSTDAGTPADCRTISGDPSDADGDGIPVLRTVEYACAAGAGTLSGSLEGTDETRDDDASVAAFRFSRDRDVTLTAAAGQSGGTAHRIAHFVATEANGIYAITESAVVEAQIAGEGGGTFTIDEQLAFSLSFSPTAGWIPGQLPSGTLAVNGSWSADTAGTGGNASYQAGVTTLDALVLDPACETLVVGGTVQASAAGPSNSGSLRVRWLGCGQAVVLPGSES